ncbi:MAG: SIMPL domain-containing protein [Oscillospiraceae bacterium]|nr:SIMPL domain-containing protein [Oscillospiraceae bacterium]
MRNIGRSIIIILALTLAAAFPALAEDSRLSVNGTSIVSLEPDYAKITAGYAAENKDIRVARDETAIKMDGIIASLRTLGIEDKDVVTSSFSVDSVYDYTKNYAVVVGYRVNSSVTITVRDIDQVASVINAVFEAGSNQSYGLEFRSSKEGEVYREALKDAIKAAAEKARLMADAAGVTLGKLVSMGESLNAYAPSPIYANARAEMDSIEAKGLGNSVMAGMLEISANVSLTYELGE